MKLIPPGACVSLAPLVLLVSVNSHACSLVMGYVRPTNYELVKQADAIVLANASSFEKKLELPWKGKFSGIFKFAVLERVKRSFEDEFLLVEGDNVIRSWGDPDDFGFTKSDNGPCNPTDYKLNGNYVLFLQNWKGTWSVGGPPFTRVNVLVEGTNASWTKAVREYARIAALNDYAKEKAALHDLRSRAFAGADDLPEALVGDIDFHFSEPTPAKSFSDLRLLYERNARPGTREKVLWACERGEKSEAMEFFQELLLSDNWLQFLSPVCCYSARVKLSGFHQVFAAALRTNNIEYERGVLLYALAAGAAAREQPLMQKVLESVSEDEAAMLGNWFVKHPSSDALKYYTKLASPNYSAHHKLDFALAAMGDTNVLNWAKKYVGTRAEDRWIGFYVFAISPLLEGDELARQLTKKGESEDLVSLVQGYGDSKRHDRLDRLSEIAHLKTKSKDLIYWLRRILEELAYEGEKRAESLLNELPKVDAPEH